MCCHAACPPNPAPGPRHAGGQERSKGFFIPSDFLETQEAGGGWGLLVGPHLLA